MGHSSRMLGPAFRLIQKVGYLWYIKEVHGGKDEDEGLIRGNVDCRLNPCWLNRRDQFRGSVASAQSKWFLAKICFPFQSLSQALHKQTFLYSSKIFISRQHKYKFPSFHVIISYPFLFVGCRQISCWNPLILTPGRVMTSLSKTASTHLSLRNLMTFIWSLKMGNQLLMTLVKRRIYHILDGVCVIVSIGTF